MRVLIVSEGVHEKGASDTDSPLEVLVRRVLPDDTEMMCDHDRLSRNTIHVHHGKGQGFFKKSLRWVLEAEKRGYQALVLLLDEDGRPERVREVSKAQTHQQITAFPRALGVAVQAFDAWMLADEQALGSALGKTVGKQPDPERIDRPKERFQEICGQETGLSAVYAVIAKEVDIPTLERRCPKGFAPFVKRVRALEDDSRCPPTGTSKTA